MLSFSWQQKLCDRIIPIRQIKTLMERMTNMNVDSMLAVFILVGISITKSVKVRQQVITKKKAISLI